MNKLFLCVALALPGICSATIDQINVSRDIQAIEDVSNLRAADQSFTAGISGLLSRVDVGLATQDQIAGMIDLYVVPFSDFHSIDWVATPHVSVSADVIPIYSSVPSTTVIGFDTTSLGLNVVAGDRYIMVLHAHLQDDTVRATMLLSCGNARFYTCSTPETFDLYTGGQAVNDSAGTDIYDANFITYVNGAPEIVNPPAVPEPGTFVLMALGLAAFTSCRLRCSM